MYEFYPRVLDDAEDVQEVVAGRKLSLPTSGRWTNRLRPGIASLSDFGDDDIVQVSINTICFLRLPRVCTYDALNSQRFNATLSLHSIFPGCCGVYAASDGLCPKDVADQRRAI